MNVLILARVIFGLSLTAMNTFGSVSYHAGRRKTNVVRTIAKLVLFGTYTQIYHQTRIPLDTLARDLWICVQISTEERDCSSV